MPPLEAGGTRQVPGRRLCEGRQSAGGPLKFVQPQVTLPVTEPESDFPSRTKQNICPTCHEMSFSDAGNFVPTLETYSTDGSGPHIQIESRMCGFWRSSHLQAVGQFFDRRSVHLVILVGRAALLFNQEYPLKVLTDFSVNLAFNLMVSIEQIVSYCLIMSLQYLQFWL